MNQPTDGPPILLFLMMFTGMLAIAVCLAALAQTDEHPDERQPRRAAGTAAAVATSPSPGIDRSADTVPNKATP